MKLTYVGTVRGFREALKAARKVVMKSGNDRLANSSVHNLMVQEFNRVQLIESLGASKRGDGIA